MATKLQKLRHAAYVKQGGLCFYCNLPIWEDDEEVCSEILSIPERLTKLLRCTAEHLCAKQDAGADVPDNIVAACWWCNSQRHRIPTAAPRPEVYRAKVRKSVQRGGFHPVVASVAARMPSD
jgi:5-methylcytosine-specific restriction endonuclease McrA